jgi:hypothetical protein
LFAALGDVHSPALAFAIRDALCSLERLFLSLFGMFCLFKKKKDGVMLAADTLESYGAMAMYTNVQRIIPIGESTLLGGGGEYSDFQLSRLVVLGNCFLF